jgi:hypothetical protein
MLINELARSIPISEVILSAGPYLRGDHGPQSKGVGQWQLKHAMQGEFAAKKYYDEIILDHFSTQLGRRGHELLTAHFIGSSCE